MSTEAEVETLRTLLLEARACIRDLEEPDWRGKWDTDALVADIDIALGIAPPAPAPAAGQKGEGK